MEKNVGLRASSLSLKGSVLTSVSLMILELGGSSLLSCWMLMAFLKSTDNRRGASFAVDPLHKIAPMEEKILPVTAHRKGKAGKKGKGSKKA